MNNQPALVEVLLATYNGERFLAQQIDSILDQDYPALRILARDDGSTDNTRALLQQYAELHPGRFLLLPPSPPTGSAKLNFAALLAAATAPYACCADQDDVWLPDKVSRSMRAMHALEQTHGTGKPLLVFTDLTVVDDRLRKTQASFWKHQGIDPAGIHHLRRTLTQNTVTGCTALLNAPLAALAATMPAEAYMHDWWIALVASAFGAAVFLRTPAVLYRQHDSNVLGAIEHAPRKLVPDFRAHTLRRVQWETSAAQAAAMLRLFGPTLPAPSRRLLAAYVRCENSPSRLVRVFTLMRNRFFLTGLRPNLAMLWYLWDMKAAKRSDPQPKSAS